MVIKIGKDEHNDCGDKYKDDINGGDVNEDNGDDGDDRVDGVMMMMMAMMVITVTVMMVMIRTMMVIIIMIINPTGVSMMHHDPVSVFDPIPFKHVALATCPSTITIQFPVS